MVTKNGNMKRNSIMALSTMLIFTACNNESPDNSSQMKTMDTMSVNAMDSMTKGTGANMPGAGNSGNNASGTSNAGINGKDTAAVGTNRSMGRDTMHKKMKH
jgi:hypothetical protein